MGAQVTQRCAFLDGASSGSKPDQGAAWPKEDRPERKDEFHML